MINKERKSKEKETHSDENVKGRKINCNEKQREVTVNIWDINTTETESDVNTTERKNKVMENVKGRKE